MQCRSRVDNLNLFYHLSNSITINADYLKSDLSLDPVP